MLVPKPVGRSRSVYCSCCYSRLTSSRSNSDYTFSQPLTIKQGGKDTMKWQEGTSEDRGEEFIWDGRFILGMYA